MGAKSTFEEIDYKLRPAKAIERKMIVEAIRRLSHFSKIEDYRYIGFGSIYFADFSLIHKALGISKMITIEKDEVYKKRVSFNLPYSCINFQNAYSHEVLPTLDWDEPTIVWLDYDKQLEDYYLSDINTVFSSIKSGGLILITINANPQIDSKLTPDELSRHRFEKLVKIVGEDKIPFDVTGNDLTSEGVSKVYRKIFLNEINECLKNRNAFVEVDEQYIFKQLFNFKYEDGAKMLTIGGIIHKKSEEEIFQKCSFGDLEFLSFNEKEYRIDVPKLTFKEVAYLDSKLHEFIEKNADGEKQIKRNYKKEIQGLIPDGDVVKYAKIYRFYPNFTEAIL